jgi:hypothetical protein
MQYVFWTKKSKPCLYCVLGREIEDGSIVSCQVVLSYVNSKKLSVVSPFDAVYSLFPYEVKDLGRCFLKGGCNGILLLLLNKADHILSRRSLEAII